MATRFFIIWYEAPRYRSKENFTSSAVTGSSLWNFAPWRNAKSWLRPSSEAVNDSARHGASGLAGIGFTIASWSAYNTMNGVMIAGVSAGSNQVVASEMGAPQISCPWGAAAKALPGAPEASPSAASASMSRRVVPRAAGVVSMDVPPVRALITEPCGKFRRGARRCRRSSRESGAAANDHAAEQLYRRYPDFSVMSS